MVVARSLDPAPCAIQGSFNGDGLGLDDESSHHLHGYPGSYDKSINVLVACESVRVLAELVAVNELVAFRPIRVGCRTDFLEGSADSKSGHMHVAVGE